MANYTGAIVVSSLKGYFEAKNHALKNALAIRCPLSVEQQTTLRGAYEGYFNNLISATEFLLDDKYPHRATFRQVLFETFVFDALPDGEQNYGYVRELRNSARHRGLDLCSSAHINADFPWMIAPRSVSNQSGKRTFCALAYYLPDIIGMCESRIGPVILKHLQDMGTLAPWHTQDEAVAESVKALTESDAMPPWAKELALKQMGSIDHVKVQTTQIQNLIDLLRFDASPLFPSRVPQSLPAAG